MVSDTVSSASMKDLKLRQMILISSLLQTSGISAAERATTDFRLSERMTFYSRRYLMAREVESCETPYSLQSAAWLGSISPCLYSPDTIRPMMSM